ncbi:MAG: hypothetical protein ONB05_10980 [candidate division KSB1 bacterium]|nr:hypothetical protein [candidate division KSB1 bacterium]
MRSDVRAKLIETARKGEMITYGELMKAFHIPRAHPKPGIGIGSVVGEISEYEHSNSRPLLSVIVVGAGSKTKMCPKGHPGGGFLGLSGVPSHLRRSSTNFYAPLTLKEQEFVWNEQQKVWKYWKAHNDDL